ncbi:MAG: hypothetical protein ACK5ME_12330 [Parahaliea sp.]
MNDIQASRLLPLLFEQIDENLPLTVLDFGPAQPETIHFLSDFHCKLHVVDLYADLPLEVQEGDEDSEDSSLGQRMEEALMLPGGALFDICLFWDVLNFMSRDAVKILAGKLRPHLHPQSRAHAFAVHNPKTPAAQTCHGIIDSNHISRRPRPVQPPNYQPHNQGELGLLLRYFQVERSVLIPDKRIEVLMTAVL